MFRLKALTQPKRLVAELAEADSREVEQVGLAVALGLSKEDVPGAPAHLEHPRLGEVVLAAEVVPIDHLSEEEQAQAFQVGDVAEIAVDVEGVENVAEHVVEYVAKGAVNVVEYAVGGEDVVIAEHEGDAAVAAELAVVADEVEEGDGPGVHPVELVVEAVGVLTECNVVSAAVPAVVTAAVGDAVAAAALLA